jgi:hypothetical protein
MPIQAQVLKLEKRRINFALNGQLFQTSGDAEKHAFSDEGPTFWANCVKRTAPEFNGLA